MLEYMSHRDRLRVSVTEYSVIDCSMITLLFTDTLYINSDEGSAAATRCKFNAAFFLECSGVVYRIMYINMLINIGVKSNESILLR